MNTKSNQSEDDLRRLRQAALVACSQREGGVRRSEVMDELRFRVSLTKVPKEQHEQVIRRLLRGLIAAKDILRPSKGRLLTDRKRHPDEWKWGYKQREANRLLQAARHRLPQLKQLLERVSDQWGYEDIVYRFYHHSFKVIRAQFKIREIVTGLQGLAPHLKLNEDFIQIVQEGAGPITLSPKDPPAKVDPRRTIEAFFHARYMLEMVCKFAAELKVAPSSLPSGWASVLYLYDLR